MTAVEREIVRARWFDYQRVGHDRRLLEFLPDQRIGVGAARCERFWRLEGEGESARLNIEGEEGVICELLRGEDMVWRGNWLKFERMPVALKPAGRKPQPAAPAGSDLDAAKPDSAPAGEDVDFVYTWVDGDEPRLKSLLDAHAASWPEGLGDEHSTSAERFRDNDELRFSLRSVERFAPWARRIFIVTNGQKPDWLNQNHPGITLVTHESIFPDQSHLPTFNSCAIECNLHRIPGLAERFVYFNDDCFLGRPVTKEDFFDPAVGHRFRFDRWGISPRAAERTANDCAIARVQEMLYEKFRRRSHWNNPAHVPHFIVKSLFREVVLTWPEAFERTSSQRFRSRYGIQPVYLYINYIIDKGLPHAVAVMGHGQKAEYGFAHLTTAHLLEIMASRPKFFAINDCEREPGFSLAGYLSRYFPEPSSFERVTA